MSTFISRWAPAVMFPLCVLPCSAESLSPADIAKAKLVVSGICEARERLQSGVYRASGYLKEDGMEAMPENLGAAIQIRQRDEHLKAGDINAIPLGPFDHSLQVNGAFDVARRLSRFDYIGPGTGPSVGRPTIGFARLDIRLVRTPDKFYRHLGVTSLPESASSLEVYEPNDPVGPNNWEFDPRLIGVFGFPQMGKPAVEVEFQRTVEHFVAPERLSHLTAVEILDGGICRLEWLLGQGSVRGVAWVNENKGPALIRNELYINRGAIAGQWPETPTETTEITWKERNSTWVPETVRFQSAQTPARDLSLKFDWTQVNEPVSEDLFQPQQLNLSGEKRITDTRLGTTIEGGTIGKPKSLPPRPPLAPATSVWQIAGMTLIVVVGAVAVFLMFRRRKSPSAG